MHRKASILGAAALLISTSAAAFAAGGPTSATINAGVGLAVTGAAPGNFNVTLSGIDQTADTTLGTYIGSDTTGSGAGWHVQFLATAFTCTAGVGLCPAGGNTFPANSLKIAKPTVVCAVGILLCSGTSAPPTISINANTAIDTGGSAVTVASAATNTGMGLYDFTPGTIGTGQLELKVPAGAYQSTYNSTVTVSIVAGP
jgi:hypothetical protein